MKQAMVASSIEQCLRATVLAACVSALAKAKADGLDPSIYSHPLGYHGHAAGSAIGMWDNQHGDERGEYPIHPNTTWSIELTAYASVPEWDGQKVGFRLEEDAYFDGNKVHYLDGRETEFTLIPAGNGGRDKSTGNQ